MESSFLITFPVWGIFACAPTESKLREMMKRPALLLWNIVVNGKPSPTFFTDREQAEDFAEREIERRPLTLMAFECPSDLMVFIQTLELGGDEAVSFDPGRCSVHQARVEDLERVLMDMSARG